jgi:hypothetical protein
MDDIEVVELSVRAGREHRDDMARWLALEVLMSDEVAMQDAVLQDRLGILQDVIEGRLRAQVATAQGQPGHE